MSNTGLPTGDTPIGPAFAAWQRMNQGMVERGDMDVGRLVAGSLDAPALVSSYDAPFPDERFKAGPLILPQRVPATPADPARRQCESLGGAPKVGQAFPDGLRQE